MTDAKDPMLTAALLAQTGEPIGPAPNDRELRAWADRSLNERRREEVESHIAHCPATCERAVAFLEQDAVAQEDSSRTRLDDVRFMGLRPRWAGVAFAVMLALLTINYLHAPSTRAPDTTPRVERSATAGISDWRLAAFMSGFLATDAAELAMLTNAAAPPADCLDGDLCAQLPGLLKDLGITLRQLESDCRENGAASAGTRPDLERLELRLRASLELAPWSHVTSDLLGVLQQQPQVACDELQALKDRSFAPRHLD